MPSSDTPAKGEQFPEPVSLRRGFRYLAKDAYRDFLDALAIARRVRVGSISLQEFRTAIKERFPARSEMKPTP